MPVPLKIAEQVTPGVYERINIVLNIGEKVVILPPAVTMPCPECRIGERVVPGEWTTCACGKTHHLILD